MTWQLTEIAWMFLIYSIVGWFWETPYVSIKEHKFVNRGFLRGPFIPIYGFAVTTVILAMGFIETKLVWHPAINAVLAMVFISLVATTWEYVTSLLMEIMFKTRWWNYTSHRFNVKGRIALDVSMFWGLGGFVLWKFVNPFVMKIYENFDINVMTVLLSLSYVVLMIDAAFTLVELISLRGLVIRLHDASEEIVIQISERLEKIGDNIEELKDNISDSLSENIIEQRNNFVDFVEEAKVNIRKNAIYQKYENFTVFSDFLEDMTDKGRKWKSENEKSLERFSELLGRARNKSSARFFKNYPNATTKQFGLMHLTRNRSLRQRKLNEEEKHENIHKR
jgi:Predicted membrane protein